MADDVVGIRYVSEGLPEMLREIKSYQTAVSGTARVEGAKSAATKESARATAQNTQATKRAAAAEKEWFALQRQRVAMRQNSARMEERAVAAVAAATRALIAQQKQADAAFAASAAAAQAYYNEILGVGPAQERAAQSAAVMERELAKQERAFAKNAAAAQAYYNEILGVGPAQERAAQSAAVMERELAKQEVATRRLAAEKDRLAAKFNPLYAASKQYERALTEIARAQQLGALNAKQHEAAIQNLNKDFMAFQSGTAGWSNQFVTGGKQGRREVNSMGMAVQQAGYQIGDFLVQVQSGTNAFVAFGQQATQLVGVLPMVAGKLGLTAGAAIGLSTGLGIAIPLVTAVAAFLSRAQSAAEDATAAFKDVGRSLKALNDARLSNLGSEFADNVERASSAFRDILATVERVELANLKEQLAAPLEALLDEIRSFDRQMSYAGQLGLSTPDFESVLGLKSRQEAVFLAQQLARLEGETREELLAQTQAIAEALTLRGLMTPQVDALLASLAEELGLLQQVTDETEATAEAAKAVTEAFVEKKTEMEQQIALQRMALQFGEDSLAVRNLENQQAQTNLDTQLKAAGYTKEQRAELGAMLGIIQQNAAALRDGEAAANGLANALARASGVAAGLLARVGGVVQGLKDQITALDQGSTAGLVALNRELNDLIETRSKLDAKGADVTQINKQIEATRGGLAEASALTKELESRQKSLSTASAGTAKTAGTAEKALEGLRKEVEKLNREADPFANYAAGLERLTELSRAGLSDAAYSKELERMNEELLKADPLLSGLNDAFGQTIDYMFDGFKDGMRGIWDIFKNTLKNMIATALKNKITFSMGAVAGGGAGAAVGGGGAPGGGGILGGLFGKALGGFGNTGSILGLGGLGGGAGFLGGLGNAVSGGLGNLFSIGANAAAAGGGLMASLGAVAPVLGIAAAAFSFFKKRVTELDAGMRVTVDGLDAMVQGFRTIETKRFWGLSKKISTEVTDLEAEIAGPLEKAVGDIMSGIVNTAGALGVASGAFDTFATEISVSTKGMTQEQAQKAVLDALNDLSDEFAGMIPGLAELQREGEGATQALQRLFTDLSAVNEAMYLFDRATFDLSLAGADAASQLVLLSGGLEAFSGKTQFVFQNMLTATAQDARLTEIAMDSLNATFGDLQFAIPETHDQFMALMDAQDLTTEAGRQTYAALLDVAGAFVQVNGTAQAAAESLRAARIEDVAAAQTVMQNRSTEAEGALRDAENALRAAFAAERETISAAYDDQINAAQAQADAAKAMADASRQSAQDRVNLTRSIADVLKRAYRDRQVLDVIGQRNQNEAATAFLRSAVAAGGTTDLDALEQALSVVADPPTGLYESFSDYHHDFNVNTNLIDQLRGLTNDQLSVEERALRAAESSVSVAADVGSRQIAVLQQARQDALDASTDQMNALLGIDTSVMTVAEAIAALWGAQAAVDASAPVSAPASTQFEPGSFGDQLNAIYNQYLKRDVGAEGLAWYGEHYTTHGWSMGQIAEQVAASDEARQVALSSFAGGGYTGDGARSGGLDGQGGFMAMLHPRETVIDHTQRRSGGADNGAVVAELKEMNQRIRYLQDKLKNVSRIQNDWNVNGQPGTRAGAVVKTEEVV